MENQKVFISYSRLDGEQYALKLANKLKEAGVNVWIDQLNIKPGNLWDREIESALGSSTHVLFIATQASTTSNNVLNEVGYAIDDNKAVIPLLFHSCKMPLRLRRLQYIDFTADYESAFQRLLSDLASGDYNPPMPPTRTQPKDGSLKNLLYKYKYLFIIGVILLTGILVYHYISSNTPDKRITALKIKAGKVNEIVVFNRYNDLFPMLADGTKIVLTKELFNSANDSTKRVLGNFIKALDTSYNKANGNENFVIRNQFEKGISMTQVIFDQEGDVFGLWTQPFPN